VTINIPAVPTDLNGLLALAFAALAILGVCAVFSPLLRVKLRRSMIPVSLVFIVVLLFAGYFTASWSLG
jgi:hypothetical protein